MQISSFRNICPVNIESDGYVPAIARFQGDFEFPPLYWRTGDFKNTLLEFGVDRRTGAISKITVTSIDGLNVVQWPVVENESISDGIPCADPQCFVDKSRIDVEQNVAAFLQGNNLAVWFGEAIPTKVVSYRCGQVTFMVDAANILRGIMFSEFTPGQIANLKFATGC
jgi:hypothetical protein